MSAIIGLTFCALVLAFVIGAPIYCAYLDWRSLRRGVRR